MRDPLRNLSKWQQDRLDVLIDALGAPALSFPERASFTLIAMQDHTTIENLAAVFRRVINRRDEREMSNDLPTTPELTVSELQAMLDHLLTTAGSDSVWVAYVRGRIAEKQAADGAR